MPPLVRMIAVHYRGKSGRGEAACFVTESSANDMIEAGQAEWGNKKMSFLTLTKTEASMTASQPSCRMDEAIVFANACGDEAAMALVAGWQPMIAFSAQQAA